MKAAFCAWEFRGVLQQKKKKRKSRFSPPNTFVAASWVAEPLETTPKNIPYRWFDHRDHIVASSPVPILKMRVSPVCPSLFEIVFFGIFFVFFKKIKKSLHDFRLVRLILVGSPGNMCVVSCIFLAVWACLGIFCIFLHRPLIVENDRK